MRVCVVRSSRPPHLTLPHLSSICLRIINVSEGKHIMYWNCDIYGLTFFLSFNYGKSTLPVPHMMVNVRWGLMPWSSGHWENSLMLNKQRGEPRAYIRWSGTWSDGTWSPWQRDLPSPLSSHLRHGTVVLNVKSVYVDGCRLDWSRGPCC